jgi:hypothetical protein
VCRWELLLASSLASEWDPAIQAEGWSASATRRRCPAIVGGYSLLRFASGHWSRVRGRCKIGIEQPPKLVTIAVLKAWWTAVESGDKSLVKAQNGLP